MKSLKVAAFLLSVLLFPPLCPAQPESFPTVDLYSLEGNRFDASQLDNDGMPMVLLFFRTDDNKCLETLYDICEAHENELADGGVKLIAVCIDRSGKIHHVKPFIQGHALNVEVYVDKNGNFKRAMGIAGVPYTILYDQQMKVICEYNGYCAGAGDLVCEKMKVCLNRLDLAQ
jgi:peroxiredoxin